MASKVMTIVLATTNPGKLAELRVLLAGLPVEVLAVTDVLPAYAAPAETGVSFEANALIKAKAAAAATLLVAIADDSGLEVDAIGGRPGVRSARFARDGATNAENNVALLAALEGVPDAKRTARFRCAIAMCDPFFDLDRPTTSEGRCEGRVLREARGAGGFGYDPLFVPDGKEQTFAELSEAQKNEISHRGQAVRALVPHVEKLVTARVQEASEVLARAR
jgi:XTP/dITP diphosphohydrolase